MPPSCAGASPARRNTRRSSEASLNSAANGAATNAARAPAAEGASLGVGRALAEAREAQGLQLADIAQQLKFMPRQIESLEAERFDALPGPTIARGMVRTYARFLKLDPEPLLARMAGRGAAPRDPPPPPARFQPPGAFLDHSPRPAGGFHGAF